MSAAALGSLLDLLADDTINGRIAKDVFEAMVETGKDPAAIVEEKGLRQVTDTGAIDAAVDDGAGRECRQGGGIQVAARTSCSASSSAR